MGRQVKRVPLDFSWPLSTVWEGYKNPYDCHCSQCSACSNGYSQYGQNLLNIWYGYTEFKPEDNGSVSFKPDDPCILELATHNVKRRPEFTEANIHKECVRITKLCNSKWTYHLNQDDVNALIEADRLWDFTHRPVRPITEEDIRTHAYYLWLEAGSPENSDIEFWEKSVKAHKGYWLPYNNGYVPTAQEVNNWSVVSTGHDSLNSAIVFEARAKKEGKDLCCSVCDGNGFVWENKEYEKLSEEWEEYEPPVGEGYQCWENVTAGSPISPVFATPEELAKYMSENSKTTYEDWLKFIFSNKTAISAVVCDGKFITGVEFIAQSA